MDTDKIDENAPMPIQKPISEGVLKIGEAEIPLRGIAGGSPRIVTMENAFGSWVVPAKWGGGESPELPRFLRSAALNPFISAELRNRPHYINYQPLSGGRGGKARGIRAEALPMICEAYIEAQAAGALRANQLHIAKACRILQNGFARVGIVALVDEATGYQDKRAKRALAEILSTFLADEVRKWTRTFPLEFYRQIYKLRGWKWEELERGKKPPTPSSVGNYTNDFVYKRIAPGLLEELRARNPTRKVRHHQWFEPQYGHPRLLHHIGGVTAIMRLAGGLG